MPNNQNEVCTKIRAGTAIDAVNSCYCIGRQNGEPYCPCQMRARRVHQRNGRWIEPERDLGPVLQSWRQSGSGDE
jgi:hypothetical protein